MRATNQHMEGQLASEFERKYVVQTDAWREHVVATTSISQGYIPTSDGVSVRVRLEARVGSLTVKNETPVDLGRTEIDASISSEEAEWLLEHVCVGLIEKTRHTLDFSPYKWTVDVFGGENSGLVLLEIEHNEYFDTDAPEWAREVSGDPRYKNSRLAKYGFAKWTKNEDQDQNDAN